VTGDLEPHQWEALWQCARNGEGIGFLRDPIALPLMKMGYLTVCTPNKVKRWRLTKEGWAKLEEDKAA
jgi:hypothetical protein